MNRKTQIFLAVGGVAAAVWYFTHAAKQAASQTTASVTATAKGGVNVTPIQTSAVPAAGIGKNFVTGLTDVVDSAVRMVRTTLSSVLPSSGNVLSPWGGSREAQKAAYTAPLRADYRPSSLTWKR